MAYSSMSVQGLANFLVEKGFSREMATKFEENGVDGAMFGLMSDIHLGEVAPRICDRIKLKSLQEQGSISTDKVLIDFL